MKSAVKHITLLYILLILLMSLAASLDGVLASVAEVGAYAIPLVIGYIYSRKRRREREELAGVAERESTLLSVKGLHRYIPLFVPTVAVVFLAAWLTSLLLGLIGKTPSEVPEASLIEMLLVHALVPAVLEELAFRYLPMKLLRPYSPRWCVILSAMFFALAHISLFQIPYALIAGVIFIVIDTACESVIPSLLLHFLNNAVSVLWIKWGESESFALGFVVTLIALSLISLAVAFLMRKRYVEDVRRAFVDGEGIGDAYAPAVFALAMIGLAFMNI